MKRRDVSAQWRGQHNMGLSKSKRHGHRLLEAWGSVSVFESWNHCLFLSHFAMILVSTLQKRERRRLNKFSLSSESNHLRLNAYRFPWWKGSSNWGSLQGSGVRSPPIGKPIGVEKSWWTNYLVRLQMTGFLLYPAYGFLTSEVTE